MKATVTISHEELAATVAAATTLCPSPRRRSHNESVELLNAQNAGLEGRLGTIPILVIRSGKFTDALQGVSPLRSSCVLSGRVFLRQPDASVMNSPTFGKEWLSMYLI